MIGRPEVSERARRIGSSLALLAVVAIFVVGTIGPPILGSRTFTASDFLYTQYPWKNLPDQPDTDPGDWGPVTDTIDGTTPARIIFAEGIRQGEVRLWNPWVAGGTAHASTPISGVYNPLNFAFLVLPFPMAAAFTKLFELAAAIGFTYLFLRRLGLRRGAATFGGIAFAGSGFLVVWSNWPQPGAAALIPALFWSTERLLQRRRHVDALPLSIATASIVLAGFPMVAVYGFSLLVPYAVVRVVCDRTRAGLTDRLLELARVAGALLLGLALSAFAWMPFVQDLRGTDLSYRSNGLSLGAETLVTTIAPTAFGDLTSESAYFGPQNQVETVSFLGATTVMLVIIGLARGWQRGRIRSVARLFSVALVAIMLAAYVGGPVADLVGELPLYSTNPIGRIRALLGFVAAVLAALALGELRGEEAIPATEQRGSSTSTRLRWLVLGLVVLGFGLFVVENALDVAAGVDRSGHMIEALKATVPIFLAGLLAVWLLVGGRTRSWAPGIGMLLLLGLLVVESLRFAAPVTPSVEKDKFYPETDDMQWLAEVADGKRVAVQGHTLYPNAPSLSEIRLATGHTFHQMTWREMLLRVDPGVFGASSTFSSLAGTSDVITSPHLDRLGVEYFVAAPTAEILGEPASLFPVVDGRSLPLGPGEFVERDLGRLPEVRAVGVEVDVVRVDASGTKPVLQIELLDEDGQVVAANQRRLDLARASSLWQVTVPTAALSSTEPITMRATVVGDADVEIGLSDDGGPAVSVVEAVDDGAELVYAGDVVVYQRDSVVDRIRWSSRAEVVEDTDERLDRLGIIDDPQTVVLSEPGPSPSGSAGSIQVLRDDPETIELEVTADGSGYATVLDALQYGWSATVDGRAAPLVDADHAGVAVFVEGGVHTVTLTYEPAGRRLGLWVTFAGWVIVLLVLALTTLRSVLD